MNEIHFFVPFTFPSFPLERLIFRAIVNVSAVTGTAAAKYQAKVKLRVVISLCILERPVRKERGMNTNASQVRRPRLDASRSRFPEVRGVRLP